MSRDINGVVAIASDPPIDDQGVGLSRNGREGRGTLEVESADAEMRRAIGSASALLLAARELAPALRGHFSDRSPIPPDTPDELTVEAMGVLEGLRRGDTRGGGAVG